MPASRASVDSSKSTLIALVIFIALFLVAAVFAIMFFMKTEQYLSDKKTAEDRLDEIANTSEYNAIKPLIDTRRRITVISRITDDVQYIIQLMAGEDVGDFNLTGVRDLVDRRLNLVKEKLAQAFGEEEQVNLSIGLMEIISTLIDENTYWQQQAEEGNLPVCASC